MDAVDRAKTSIREMKITGWGTWANVVTDLLAELERVENSREAECMECEKLVCTEIRQQAARECVEIIDKYPAFLFGTDAVGVTLNLSQGIKAHFKLEEHHD